MKSLLIVLSLALCVGAAFARATHAAAATASQPASAAAASPALALATQPGTPQRMKMKTCNADAKTKDLHGDQRRAFMKQCLSGKARPAAAS
jgi:curli biogenesis system outer membrane secretion channel CsgG